jgi:hypothetical protein
MGTCQTVVWNLVNVPSLLILGLSTPLVPEQRATSRSGQPFIVSVHTWSQIGLDPMAL